VISTEVAGLNNQHNITFTWDAEAQIWAVTDEDGHSLEAEHGSLDAFIDRVRLGVLDLLEEDGRIYKDISLNIDISGTKES